ncbi:hypothetical protein Tco_1135907, partial [Tanacetum coccineum]
MNRKNVLTERTEYPYLMSSSNGKEMDKKMEATPALFSKEMDKYGL